MNRMMKYLFFKLNAIKYDPLSSKEEISMQLEALHLRMRKVNALKLEENKAHNQKHWAATLDLIDKIKQHKENGTPFAFSSQEDLCCYSTNIHTL